MVSKKMVIIVVVILLLFFNMTILTMTGKLGTSTSGVAEKLFIPIVSPFQKNTVHLIRNIKGVWEHYFYLISVAQENRELRDALSRANEQNNLCRETALLNSRLRGYFKFKERTEYSVIVSEVIAKDSSAWFKTIIIDKGSDDGVKTGFPVVVPAGIAGQVIAVAAKYSKVLLMIDRNSAVDALVQRTRARGIIKGESGSRCLFKYALRKHDIVEGDIIVSSRLDGVYPKGLKIGKVANLTKKNYGIFQEVRVEPSVDFERLEEVLIILDFEKGKSSE